MAEAVVIIGSPRSGTSLSTNVTFEMGYHADFERANKFNENRIWENDELVTINEILMNFFGTGIARPNALPPDWKVAKSWSSQSRGSESHSENEFLWAVGLEYSATLHYSSILEGIASFGYQVSDMRSRNPSDVAKSMKRAYGIDESRGEEVWLSYTLNAIMNTMNERRMFVYSYDDYFEKPE